MKIISIHKDKLFHLEGNPRQIVDKSGIDKLRTLIKGHGFRGVLDVFSHKGGKYEILCGNHRFDAGVAEGIENFNCQIYPGTRKQAMARAISDNKSSEWTDWDIPALKGILSEIDDGSLDMELTGFEKDEIDNLFGNEKGFGGSGDDDRQTCPECGKVI